jgi:hypothetical protein
VQLREQILSSPNSVVDSSKWLKLGLNGEEQMGTDGRLESYEENAFQEFQQTSHIQDNHEKRH